MALIKNDREGLCQTAINAMLHAHAPYSGYLVGAAVLADSGEIYTGCNVENASYGLSMCAERVAVGKAISQGERKIIAVAVATRDGGSPCGACRQVLAEFADGDLEILLVHTDGSDPVILTLEDLLPHRFSFEADR